MALIDDLSLPTSEGELERRRALIAIGGGAIAAAALGTMITAVRYLSPAVLYEASTRFRAGPIDAIPLDGLVSFPQQKLYLGRSDSGIYALSATCTHLGCMTRYEAESRRLFCPCHGSRFSLTGEVLGGPAPQALAKLKVIIERGAVVVDTSQAGDVVEI